MEIHDPHACIARELQDCETARQVNGIIPVLSTKDDQWFAVQMVTGESLVLEALEADELPAVREAIAFHIFSKLLLGRCHQAHDSGDEADKGQAILARVDYAQRFGDEAIRAAEQHALASGFTQDEIGRAYNLLESKDESAAIPVTRISDLQKPGEGEA